MYLFMRRSGYPGFLFFYLYICIRIHMDAILSMLNLQVRNRPYLRRIPGIPNLQGYLPI